MPDQPTGFSLRRWSRRKLAAAREAPDARRDGARAKALAAPGAQAPSPPPTPAAARASPAPAASSPGPARPAATADAGDLPVPLPPLESLTGDSDFSPFMQPGVDEATRRVALRRLLRNPRFNVMDGLDVYIDDYSKPSPLEPSLVRTLAQARYILDPPKTRVTAEGAVEDVPDEPVAVAAAEPASLPSLGSVSGVEGMQVPPAASQDEATPQVQADAQGASPAGSGARGPRSAKPDG